MEDTRKNQISIDPRTMNILTSKGSKFSNLFYHKYYEFQEICSRDFYLLVAGYYLIRSKLKSLIHSFISCPN